MNPEELLKATVNALEDRKAKEINVIDVRGKSNVADYVVIATGTSSRHTSSTAEHVALELKRVAFPAQGIEGKRGGEWVLVDFGDVVVHVMKQETRDFYQLDELWEMIASESI